MIVSVVAVAVSITCGSSNYLLCMVHFSVNYDEVFCVVSCLYVEALRRADPPSKESYRLSNGFIINFRKLILNRNRLRDLILERTTTTTTTMMMMNYNKYAKGHCGI